jgi:hypothetical protein
MNTQPHVPNVYQRIAQGIAAKMAQAQLDAEEKASTQPTVAYGTAVNEANALPAGLPGGLSDHHDQNHLFRQVYPALLANEIEELESAALVRSEGKEGYDKPLSGGQRKRLRRTAHRLAARHTTAEPLSPEEERTRARKGRAGNRKSGARTRFFRAERRGATLPVYSCTMRPAEARNDKQAWYGSPDEAKLACLENLDVGIVGAMIDQGYHGPLPKKMSALDINEARPGMLTRILAMQKLFG